MAAAGGGGDQRVQNEVQMSTTNRSDLFRGVVWRSLAAWCTCALIAAPTFSSHVSAQAARQFASPEDAVKSIIAVVKAGNLAELAAILGADGKELIEPPIRRLRGRTEGYSPSRWASNGTWRTQLRIGRHSSSVMKAGRSLCRS